MKSLATTCWFLAAALVLIQLGRAPAQEEEKKKHLFEGRWKVIRQEERGGLVPPIVSKRLSMVIEGDEMGWYIGNPAPNLTATLTFNEAKKTVDAEITRGSFFGKIMLGIYRIDKDKLEMCWSEPGGEKRPTKFTTVPGAGGGLNYYTYLREKEFDDRPKGEKEPPPPVKRPTPKGTITPGAGGGKDIRTLQAKLPDKWKDEGVVLDVKTFKKDVEPRLVLFAETSKLKMPTTGAELAEMAKNEPNLFPNRIWVKTVDVGKSGDVIYLIGVCKALGFEYNGIAMARNVDGTTVMFVGEPAEGVGDRKEMLDICKSASFK